MLNRSLHIAILCRYFCFWLGIEAKFGAEDQALRAYPKQTNSLEISDKVG
jgi:hypothetical protein